MSQPKTTPEASILTLRNEIKRIPTKENLDAGKVLTPLTLTRFFGIKALGCDEKIIKVWAKDPYFQEKVNRYAEHTYNLGEAGSMSQETHDLLNLLLVYKGNGKWGFDKTTKILLREAAETKFHPWVEVDENNAGLLSGGAIVGFGEPYNNGNYGAGPTRNPLRATYAARLITVIPDVPLLTTSIFRTAKPSVFLSSFGRNIKELFDGKFNIQYAPGMFNVGMAFSQSDHIYLGVYLKNVYQQRVSIVAREIRGDVVLETTTGSLSGHAFIPPEGRGESPLWGSLRDLFGTGADDICRKAQEWAADAFRKANEVLTRIVPQDQSPESIHIITVYNT